ncbi:uncharacterized protein LACBIDRAFT_304518 [Laccaria bicolor S238N-H82]|uniref:Predicted protein n=1 Tax=Laccaria bicolor (strain S238N-H82 / ATCC MYA-4686) TaxID=486041 RepID=B0DLT6_LACBS|nr:uncharacterized protein LACBIDRAFT_304518 [Laccaria bicolor S238N-H82]EDR04451.1 predicted protein [Laccaria bicolor S238N-H82]|eukprot:XP_001884970.1 predicted protein [Laccaria bicolor S238N-H82]
MKTPTKPPIYQRQQPSAQDKPPTLTESAHENACRQNPALRPIDEDPVPLGKPTEDTAPTVQPAPFATRPPLRPARPRPPRLHTDTQMRRY